MGVRVLPMDLGCAPKHVDGERVVVCKQARARAVSGDHTSEAEPSTQFKAVTPRERIAPTRAAEEHCGGEGDRPKARAHELASLLGGRQRDPHRRRILLTAAVYTQGESLVERDCFVDPAEARAVVREERRAPVRGKLQRGAPSAEQQQRQMSSEPLHHGHECWAVSLAPTRMAPSILCIGLKEGTGRVPRKVTLFN